MKPEVVYWRGSAESQLTLIRLLQVDGYKVLEYRTLEEVLNYISRKRPELILVDCSGGEREAAQRLMELQTTEVLYPSPVAIVGPNIESRCAELWKVYDRFLPIDLPFQTDQIVRALRQLIGDGSGDRTHVSAGRIPNYGGHILAVSHDLARFSDMQLIGEHPNAKEIKETLDLMTETSRWLGLHARRVALFGANLCQAVGFDAEQQHNLKIAGLLLNQALQHTGTELLRWDKFSDDNQEFAEQFALGVRDSAEFVDEEIGDQGVADTLRLVSELVQGEDVLGERSGEAKCLLTAELIDRACWSSGFWNPRSVNLVLRKIAENEDVDNDDEIAWAFGRALAESVSDVISITSLFQPSTAFQSADEQSLAMERDREDAVVEAVETFGKDELISIPLPNLAPGMRLARPVVSADGRVILKANVKLTKDVIFHVWRLAAIRPLAQRVDIVNPEA